MNKFPRQIEEAVKTFSELPGVGPRTALRYVLNLLSGSSFDRKQLITAIESLDELHSCPDCGAYSESASLCDICTSEQRVQEKTICVVENFNDLIAVENTGNFRGTYHILSGVLNPLLGIGPSQLRISQLQKRVGQQETEALILAINPSVEGDATCSYLKQIFSDQCRVERIGFGVPIGGSLEFLDSRTISTAFENRKSL